MSTSNWEQKGLLRSFQREHTTTTLCTQEAPIMRLRISSLRRIAKKNPPIEFVQQDLTSYGGLKLVRRYFRLIDLNRRIRQSFNAYGLGGDYGSGPLLLLVITLFVVGAGKSYE